MDHGLGAAVLNLILRGSSGGERVHIVEFVGPLSDDTRDARGYWGQGLLAVCGRQVTIRVPPYNLPPGGAKAAHELGFMPVETWRWDDLPRTCRQCLELLDPRLRAILGVEGPNIRPVE